MQSSNDTAPTPAPDGVPVNSTIAANSTISQRGLLAVYKQMLLSLFIATLVIAAILILMLLPFFISYAKGDTKALDPPLLIVVQLAGALGAFFSALIRLYNFQDLPKALVARELEGLPRLHLLVYSLVPAIVGAIAATVIHMLFASGLLQGDFFPIFKCEKGDNLCTSFGSLIADWGPAQAKDYAKDIVWGFVAGFAERLVPDTLQSLSRSVQKEKSNGDGGSNADTGSSSGPANS
jgi:hypothetical protein